MKATIERKEIEDRKRQVERPQCFAFNDKSLGSLLRVSAQKCLLLIFVPTEFTFNEQLESTETRRE